MRDGRSKLVFFDRAMLAAKEFWLRTLAREVDVASIPLDHPRPKRYRESTETVTFEIAGAPREDVRRLSGDRPLLVHTLFLAALNVLLHKVTGGRVMVVGSPARGSEAPNALPILSEIDPAQTFRDFLAGLRRTLLDAYTHQAYPFTALARDFGLDHVDNRCPMFDVALSLEGYHGELPAVRNDVSITLSMEDGRILGRIAFNAVLYETPSVERLARGLTAVLEAALRDTTVTIRDLDILTAAERHQVLREWSRQPADFPHDRCLHELVEGPVDRAPAAPAVSFAGRSLSYRELDEQANQLAWYLRRLGVGPEIVVGLCVPPSLDRVVAALGVLKAGGAFLPLEPDYPTERLAFMLDDAKVPVVVTVAALRPRLERHGARVVCLDEDAPEIGRQPTARPHTPIDPAAAAYVIYTSGSTGRPKGVVCAHRGLANLAAAQVKAFGVTPSSRVLQFSAFSFDASVSEIAMALYAGATLVLDRREAMYPGIDLLRFLRDHAITHVTLPPSILAVLPAGSLPALTTLIVAGEACDAALVAQWAPGRRFVNAYGPTETTVCATLGECEPDEARPAIGRPMANMEVYVLDDQLMPVLPGVSGELFIGGVGVARGYVGNPAATAEKFVPDPFSDREGARLYRSGDRARFLRDGRIDFQGRLDHQVKIRGFRIELAEIEAALALEPMVAENVVLCREDTPGVKRLVAYLVPTEGQEPTESGLRDHLKRVLPDYMIPEAFVLLRGLPKTAKMTVARDQLPPPRAVKRDAQPGLVPPRDAVELTLVQIWERILGKSPVGVRDNFFELGGHSLLAVKLLSEIQRRFDRDFPLPTLLKAPTIEELATVVREDGEDAAWSPTVAIQPVGSRRPVFCVHPAGGTVLCYADLAAALGPDQPFYGLQEFGLLEGQTPLARVEDMASLYVKAMREVEPTGPYLLAGWSFGGVVAYEMACQLREDDQEVALLALFDAYAPAAMSETLRDMDEVKHIISLFGDDVELSEQHLRRLTSDEQFEYVLARAKDVDLVPPSFTTGQVRRVMDVFRINAEAVHAWRPAPYEGSVTLFVARDKTEAIASVTSDDESHGWAAVARGGVAIQRVDGNHHTIMRPPHVRGLGDRLRACIDGVGGSGDRA